MALGLSSSGSMSRLTVTRAVPCVMGAQWKAKGKAAAADARGKLFGRWPRTSWWPRAAVPTRLLNSRLRLVVEQARKVSMPKDTLERAIKKGAGLTGEAVTSSM
jgi:transcriptional/translational regulatory protein YebC/TACO1